MDNFMSHERYPRAIILNYYPLVGLELNLIDFNQYKKQDYKLCVVNDNEIDCWLKGHFVNCLFPLHV